MAAITLTFPIEILLDGSRADYMELEEARSFHGLLGEKNFEKVKKGLLRKLLSCPPVRDCLDAGAWCHAYAFTSPDGRDGRCIAVYQRICHDISPGKAR